jgi:hypothetical protein
LFPVAPPFWEPESGMSVTPPQATADAQRQSQSQSNSETSRFIERRPS